MMSILEEKSSYKYKHVMHVHGKMRYVLSYLLLFSQIIIFETFTHLSNSHSNNWYYSQSVFDEFVNIIYFIC